MKKKEQKSEIVFAQEAKRHALLYEMLAKNERCTTLRQSFFALSSIADEAAGFWSRKSEGSTETRLSNYTYYRYRLLRFLLGATLTMKYILGRKEAQVMEYKTYCITCTVAEDHETINDFVAKMHDVVSETKEQRVKFFSNIILGFNDALIELTGVLVGFTFVFREPNIIAIAGFITGLSASMSMAASAYQQARHEKGRNPTIAAMYTGGSYLAIATILVLPFVIFDSAYTALIVMGIIILGLVFTVSFYSSVLLDRRYISQLGEMMFFSVGVAIAAFIIGQSLSIVL